MTEEADYIVVGAGSAGCIIASRLAETGARVVLLEAGKRDRSRVLSTPGMVSVMHSVPQVKKPFDWGGYSVEQQHAAGRRIPMTRGKVLGGSSSINGMLFVRGHRSNYDDWAADGCAGWSFDEVLPSFKRLEDWEGGADELRGAGGPVPVTRQKQLNPASSALIQAISKTMDVPVTDDYNGPSQEGVGPVQMSAANGTRFSTSRAYLSGARGTHPRVETGVTVSRVVIDGDRAIGVEVLDRSGPRLIRASTEVVVSAGVMGSPQLLMLSGVGPASHLRERGLDVRADLPVGQNLHDHLFVPMTFLAPEAVHRGVAPHFLNGLIEHAVRGDGWMGRTVFDSMAFVHSGRSSARRPDLQIHTMPWAYPSPNQDEPVRHKVDPRPALTVLPTLIYPKSRGQLRLASADPSAAPLIDPGYLAERDDAEFLLDAIERMRDVMASRAMSGVVTGELHPGPRFAGRAELARELPNRVHSVYHPGGTCRMGSDERAVVDSELRVRGVPNLRVADASIMPTITGGNTNAPSMMIGERCAELVRRAAGSGRGQESSVGGA